MSEVSFVRTSRRVTYKFLYQKILYALIKWRRGFLKQPVLYGSEALRSLLDCLLFTALTGYVAGLEAYFDDLVTEVRFFTVVR